LGQFGKGSYDRGFCTLKKHDPMRNTFLERGTTDESNKKYIAVWERFKDAVKIANN
jgi:hypothetical protein